MNTLEKAIQQLTEQLTGNMFEDFDTKQHREAKGAGRTTASYDRPAGTGDQ